MFFQKPPSKITKKPTYNSWYNTIYDKIRHYQPILIDKSVVQILIKTPTPIPSKRGTGLMRDSLTGCLIHTNMEANRKINESRSDIIFTYLPLAFALIGEHHDPPLGRRQRALRTLPVLAPPMRLTLTHMASERSYSVILRHPSSCIDGIGKGFVIRETLLSTMFTCIFNSPSFAIENNRVRWKEDYTSQLIYFLPYKSQ